MMSGKRRYTVLRSVALLMLMVCPALTGQSPMSTYFMETIPQVRQINPAMMPRANGFYTLPGIELMVGSDLSFSNIFQDKGSEWVSPLSRRFDYDKLYRATGKVFNVNEQTTVDILGFGFRRGRDYFSISYSIKGDLNAGLPRDLFKVTEKGFADGSVFDFSTLRMKTQLYKEINIGYAREWNDKLNVGINVKPLFGMVAGMTDINRLELRTSREKYEVLVDGSIRVSAPVEITEGVPGEFPEDIEGRELEDSEMRAYLTGFRNPGFAIDLGAVYKFNDKWHFSAAVNNLGFISWKSDLNSLSFKGNYSFEGLELDGSNKDDLDDALEAIGDSLKSIINYSTGHGKFSTSLVPGIWLGAEYHLNHYMSFGFISRSMLQKNNFREDLNISANYKPYSFVSVNVNYSYCFNGANGLGTALSVLLGPLQIYAVADYALVRYSNVIMDDSEFVMFPYQKQLNVRAGLNLIFGRHGNRNNPSIDFR